MLDKYGHMVRRMSLFRVSDNQLHTPRSAKLLGQADFSDEQDFCIFQLCLLIEP
jgi:hypothetical protein